MDCKKMARQLYEFLDRELDEKQLLEFQSHLAACEKCFDRVEFEKVLRLSVRKGLTCKMPDDLRSKIHETILCATEDKKSPRKKS